MNKEHIHRVLTMLIASAVLLPFSLFSAMSLTGCDVNPAPAGTEPDITSSDPAPLSLTVIKDGKTDYAIVRQDEINNGIVDFCVALRNRIKSDLGIELTINVDFYMPDESYVADAAEILVGDTNRPESAEAKALLDGLDGIRFIIRVSGSRLVINANETFGIYHAFGYILSNLIKDGELTLPADYQYISDNMSDTGLAERVLTSGKPFAFFKLDTAVKIKTQDGFAGAQGGGTDGTFAYYALIDPSTVPEMAIFVKYRLDTWERVAVSAPVQTGHSNDITYDPVTDCLVVSYCSSTDGWRGICRLDRNTLELKEYFVSPVGNRGIEYLPERSEYVIGNGYNIMITDRDFNIKSQFTCSDPRAITQGLFSDGKYIYDARYNTDGGNFVVVHDLSGTYIGSAALYNIPGEPENIFRYGDYFYVGYHKAPSVWRTVLLPADRNDWWVDAD